MRLLVDEDTQAKTLVRLLSQDGHDVLTAKDAGLNSMSDAEVMTVAINENRVLLTKNCADFLLLNTEIRRHSGILAIYQGADPSKNMRYAHIAKAIHNVEQSGVSLDGQLLALNAWNW